MPLFNCRCVPDLKCEGADLGKANANADRGVDAGPNDGGYMATKFDLASLVDVLNKTLGEGTAESSR